VPFKEKRTGEEKRPPIEVSSSLSASGAEAVFLENLIIHSLNFCPVGGHDGSV